MHAARKLRRYTPLTLVWQLWNAVFTPQNF